MKSTTRNSTWKGLALAVVICLTQVWSARGTASITETLDQCVAGANFIEFRLMLTNTSTAGETLYVNSPTPMRINHSAAIVPTGTNTYTFAYVAGSADALMAPLYATLATTYNVSYTSSSRLMQLTTSTAILGNYQSATNAPILPGASLSAGKFRLTITNTNFVAGASVGLTWVTTSGITAYINTALVSTAFNSPTSTTAQRVLNPPPTYSIPAACTLAASATSTAVTCTGDLNGSATVAVTGNTGTPTYLWSNGATTQSISGLSAGSYTVTVTDGACTSSSTTTVGSGTPRTSSLTTLAQCDSYTWSVNGATYTQSGTYVSSSGCATDSLVLTISPSTSNTTPVSACDSYTWSVNGTTYTQSGTYSSTTGCNTEILNLTINPSFTNTSSASACDSYTWSVNGQTYSQSGSYTSVSGCSTSVLNLTVTPSSTNTTNALACSSYVWSVNGQTYTASGTYSQTVGCVTELLNLTISPLTASSSAGTIACNGGTTTVSVSASGGTTPYTGTGSFTRAAGSYTFTVTDAAGCSATTSVTISEPTAVSASASAGTILCNGGSTTVTVSATGGTSPYTGTGSFTASAGAYSYTVTDANGCTGIASGTITEPAALSASASAGTILCNGGSTTVTVSATGGTSPYTGTGSFTRSAGSYTFTVSDNNGCSSIASVTVTEPAVLSASASAGTIACFNGSTSVTVSATGGTTPYTGTGSFTRTAGSYTFTVTDNNGCSSTSAVTITEPSQLLASSSAGAIACFGGSTTVTVSGSGGTSPYTGTGSFTRTAGTFSFTIVDANGCTAVTEVTITQPSVLSASASAGSITCFGGSTTVTVSASGGTTPYTGTGSFTRTAGTYTFTVSDTNGCSTTASVTVTQPAVLTVSTSGSNPTTVAGSNGSVTATPGGGTTPYSYLWSNGATTSTVTGLTAGTYTVTVTDANGCTATGSRTITDPACTLSASIGTVVNVSCNGGSNGSATASASGATGTATYLWSNGATTASASGLAAGSYSVVITDAAGCTASASTTITQPSALSATSSAGTIACFGGSTTVTVSGSGGTTPYTGTGSFTRTAGNYSFTITDARGCTAITSVNITQPSALSASASAGSISCFGGSTSVTVSASGGTTPYTGTGSFTRTAGTYTFTVSDANGCSATASVTVTQPAVLTVSTSGSNPTTVGGSNGSVTATPGGGTTPYSYLWSNGATTSTATGLTAGTYTVTVTDANGCTATGSRTLTNPNCTLSASIGSVTNVSCNGGSNGSATASASGANGSATYLWSNGTTTATASGLVAGTYSVVITDGAGCTASSSTTITQPAALSANSSSGNIACFGGSTTVTVTASGGTTPYTGTGNFTRTAGTYTFTVSDSRGCTATTSITVTQPAQLVASSSSGSIQCNGGSTSVTVSATGGTTPYTGTGSFTRTAGTYTFTVSDANGCTSTSSITVTQPTALSISVTGTNPTTVGGTNGTVSASVTGGTTPYSYLWSNGGTTSSQSGLTAGTYSVTVTDANGCTIAGSKTLTNPNCALSVSVGSVTNVSCNGGSNGSATASTTGANGAVTYLWSNGATTATASGLAAGSYSVVATDGAGCTASGSVTITQPAVLNASASGGTIACFGGSTTVTVTATGGTSPYTGTGNFTRTAGSYVFTVTDSRGCSDTAAIILYSPEPIIVTAVPGTISCNGGSTSVTVSANGGTSPYSGTGSFTRTAGTYTFTVTDNRGCTGTASVTITQPTALVVTMSSTNPSATGATDGTAGATVSGGTSPYSYLWSNGQTTSSISGLGAGTYTITVTDANGCTRSGSVTLTTGVCGAYRTYPRGVWGNATAAYAGSFLSLNFATAYPNGLQIGDCGAYILLTSAANVRAFLPSGGTVRKLNNGTLVNPTGNQYGNTFAANVVALNLNITFDLVFPSFSVSGIPLKDAVVMMGPFTGWTVQQVYNAANNAIGCGGSKTYLNNLNDAIDQINLSWQDGIQRNNYIACPQTAVVRSITDRDGETLTRPSAYPNPTSDRLTVSYNMTEAGKATIEVYSLTGQRVLREEVSHAGMGEFTMELSFDAAGLSSGLYLVRVIRNGSVDDIRVVVAE